MDANGLLERDAQLGEISKAIERATAGSGGTILVRGSAGIGKSALLTSARELGRAGELQTIAARGAELEREFSYGIVRQLLERTVASAAPTQRESLFDGSAGLSRGLFEPGDQVQTPSPPDSLAFLHGLYWLVANLAQDGPLLFVIDDLHWSDTPSLRFVEYLSRRLEGLPLLVLCAFRPSEPGSESVLLRSIAASPGVAVIDPPPLSEAGSAHLVRRSLSPAADGPFCGACHEASGGNPLLLHELVRAIGAAGIRPVEASARGILELGGTAVAGTVGLRLERLPPAVARLAEAAAVLGDGATIRDAATLAGLEDEAAYEAAAALYQLDVLHRQARIGFVHPLVRAAIYERLDPGAREGAHEGAARLLDAAGAPPERIAAHLLLVPPAGDPAAVATLREAARRALATGGPENAVSYLRRAREEGTSENRAALLLELGHAEALVMDPKAIASLEAAAGAARDPLDRAAALGAMGLSLYLDGEMAGAAERTREALEQIEPGSGGEAEAQLLLSYSLAARAVPELVEEVAAVLDRPRTDPRGGVSEAEVVRLIMAGLDAFLRGKRDSAIVRLEEATEQVSELSSTSLPILATLGWFQGHVGHRREAEANLGRALEQARRTGSHLHMQVALDGRTYVRWTSGDPAGAIADAETMIRLSDGAWDPATTFARVARAVSLLERGESEEAASALELPASLEERLAGTWWLAWLCYGRGRRALSQGRWAEAREHARTAGRRVLAIEADSPEYMPWRSLAARASAQLEELESALSLTREEVELARRTGSPRAIGIALASRGVVEGGERGIEALREADEALSRSPDKVEHARALAELGGALRRANHRADAREPLRRAIELAHDCGMAPLEDRAHSELRATGARPRRLRLSGPESLTPSERRVAEMAADGLTNREIAQRLFVTTKTVEVHLTSSYRKLGIDSRAGLRNALGEGAPGRR